MSMFIPYNYIDTAIVSKQNSYQLYVGMSTVPVLCPNTPENNTIPNFM